MNNIPKLYDLTILYSSLYSLYLLIYYNSYMMYRYTVIMYRSYINIIIHID